MAGLPHMPLFVKDYLIDTVALSLEESGAYLHLLMHAWTRGGRLPDDDRQLAAMCKVGAKKWASLRPTLEPFWAVEDGHWTNKRLSQELQFVSSKSEKRAAAGAKGGRAKASNANDLALAKPDFAVAPTPTPTLTEEGRKEGRALAPEEPPSAEPSDGWNGESLDALSIAQDCARAGGVRFVDPGHISTGVQLVREWQQAGADPPLMIETIRAVVSRTQDTIGSLKFFDRPIRQAVAKREAERNGTAPAQPSGRKGEPTFSELALAQLDRLRSGGEAGLGAGGDAEPRRLGFDPAGTS